MDLSVIFIDGLVRAEELFHTSEWDSKSYGRRAVILEEDPEKIERFATTHEVEVVLKQPWLYGSLAWRYLFLEAEYHGDLEELREVVEQIHMVASEYRDFGKTILTNVQSNLLQTERYIDGRSLAGSRLGQSVIVVGSGPSLEQALPFIRASQGKSFILAAGSATILLLREGIRPDAMAFIDPDPPVELYRQVASEIAPLDFPLFYQNRMSAKLFHLHQGSKIWMGTTGGWPLEERLLSELGFPSWIFDGGWNVGNFATHIAHFLGFKQIEFAGMDQMEAEREGKKDFYFGGKWQEELANAPPLYLKEGGKLERNIERAAVEALLRRVHNGACVREVTHFLEQAVKGAAVEDLKRAKILMEAELIGDILYEELLLPLWQILGPLYTRELTSEEQEGIKGALFQAAFYRRVLEAHRC